MTARRWLESAGTASVPECRNLYEVRFEPRDIAPEAPEPELPRLRSRSPLLS
jgi:hypothetical protein